MQTIRDRLLERRLHSALLPRIKPRRIAVIWQGRVISGTDSTHKLRTGRLYNLRLRIWRRFHTLPMFGR